MRYPTYDHKIETDVEYKVHGHQRIVGIAETLKEARELFAKEKDETGCAMIIKRTVRIITLVEDEHVQGNLSL